MLLSKWVIVFFLGGIQNIINAHLSLRTMIWHEKSSENSTYTWEIHFETREHSHSIEWIVFKFWRRLIVNRWRHSWLTDDSFCVEYDEFLPHSLIFTSSHNRLLLCDFNGSSTRQISCAAATEVDCIERPLNFFLIVFRMYFGEPFGKLYGAS